MISCFGEDDSRAYEEGEKKPIREKHIKEGAEARAPHQTVSRTFDRLQLHFDEIRQEKPAHSRTEISRTTNE